MGGTTFWTEMPGDMPIAEAYNKAVDEAAWEHGHGGYTGTIAEKSGYVEFAIPAGLTAIDVLNLIRAYEGNIWAKDEDKVPVAIPPGLNLERIYEVYDDKWGPAVAFKADGKWVFCGWAST